MPDRLGRTVDPGEIEVVEERNLRARPRVLDLVPPLVDMVFLDAKVCVVGLNQSAYPHDVLIGPVRMAEAVKFGALLVLMPRKDVDPLSPLLAVR